MRYRRARISGGTYFFTVVTHARAKLLTASGHIEVLREAFAYGMRNYPFQIDAIVVLPDHLHCIWTLPENDHNYATRWRLIKGYFTRKAAPDQKPLADGSRRRKREKAIWQRRFWEHLIRDPEDFKKHVDYIHYNPVKHGYVGTPGDWQHSSFHKYVREGKLDPAWGRGPELSMDEMVGRE